ncbi:hypothetical protein FHQ18_04430 [Deferribacter autotrophicus]|uniref:Uncharacterized protein n=1 Tax=Deferribacter autotrophicus TaxID=500465 RepID=A0A5A8F4A9_9BACT|nr:hypothetical protein [Deferribacter autotrophicus]KAA0258411.1 hypothetical protein FHQ18_04430 [Deferribacter autotrophicus]
MRSEVINEIIFVNPSPNMIKLSRIIKRMGYKVIYASTDLYFPCFFDSAYLIDDKITRFSSLSNINTSKEDIYYLFKKSLFNKLKFLRYKKRIGFNTVSLMERIKSFKESQPLEKSKTERFSDILNDGENYKIVFSYLPKQEILKLGFLGNDYNIFKIEGEQEFIDTIQKSTFYILKKNGIEIFRYENYIIVKTENSNLELNKIYKYLDNYNLEVKKIGQITKKENPWIEKKSLNGKEFFYINDYSVFNFSIKIWDDWYEKLARFICTEKQR